MLKESFFSQVRKLVFPPETDSVDFDCLLVFFLKLVLISSSPQSGHVE